MKITITINMDLVKAIVVSVIAFFPVVNYVLFGGSPWWALVWLMIPVFYPSNQYRHDQH
ncbi:MAG: hypothetical protein LCH91_13725 [Bacteroidetes bacterium]|nr:hypothetical protein [Bacteroidota bacterium]